MNKGMNFTPAFSLPLLINPSTNEPSIDVDINDTIEYLIIKSCFIAIPDIENGIETVDGISTKAN